MIVYEQAIRFLADHLDGDRYYRIARPGHNLDRARAQLALLASIESASPELERIVGRARPDALGRSTHPLWRARKAGTSSAESGGLSR